MRKIIVFLFIILPSISTISAQSVYQPYSFQFYQKLNSELYSPGSRFHTALKPYFIDDSLLHDRASALLNLGLDSNRKTWLSRKLFNEHLLDIKNDEYTIFADFLPDLQIGRDFAGKKTTWLNTRGYQVGGTIGKKFSFYTSGFENQGVFPRYLSNYSASRKVVSGQSREFFIDVKDIVQEQKDWQYVSALISYTPNKYLNITFGQDKNFIGDGYRSLLLSDFSTNYPFLKLTGTLGNVQYMAMWTAMQDLDAPTRSYETGNRRKGGVFHYLDWNVNNRLSLGFFDSIIWAETDDDGNVRGFDWGYANPIIFLRPVEAGSGSPDNALLGLTAKYEFATQLVGYGQVSLDEFEASNFFSGKGSSRNKYGIQLGIKGANIFKVENLNYLLEYNTAKPYTYTSRKPIINYAHYNEPLAHPLGANFREILGIVNYSLKRFDFSGQLLYAKYGLDGDRENFGKDIFQPYGYATDGNYTGQGLRTDLYYAEGKVAFLLNPKYNLRFELGGIFRYENNLQGHGTTTMVSFGLRSTFRNLYQDF